MPKRSRLHCTSIIHCSVILFLSVSSIQAQELEWLNKTVDGIKYSFPADYKAINMSNATGITYNAENMYMTVTSLTDTEGVNPDNPRAYSEYYKSTVKKVVQRLSGRVREVRDTIIGGQQCHFSSIEVKFNDAQVTKYDLLQVYQNGKLHGFSCQYEPSNKSSVTLRNTFFSSIRMGTAKSESGRSPAFTRLAIAGAVFLVMIALMLRARRKIKREPTPNS